MMQETTTNERNGIQWTLCSQLDDLDFADDLALLPHTYKQMLEKTSVTISTTAKQVGRNIHRRKTKVVRMITANTIQIKNQLRDYMTTQPARLTAILAVQYRDPG